MKSHTTLLSTTETELHRNKRYLGLLLQVAVFFSLFGVFSGSGTADGGSGRQLLWGTLGIIAITYLATTLLSEEGRRYSFGGWPIMAILVYVTASIAWSTTPTVTFKRSILLLLLVLVCGVSVGERNKDWREEIFSKILSRPVALLLLLSLLITIAMPGYAFTDIGWRGIATHKNEAGQMAAFAALLAIYGVCHDKLGRVPRAFILLGSIGCLILAKSSTPLICLFIGAGITEIVVLRSTIKKLGSWQVGALGVVLIISGVLFFAFQLGLLPSVETLYSKILVVMGKSDTFSGRTEIWHLVLKESQFHNPWFGGGYGGFWNGRESISGYVLVGLNLYPGQAHNGFIDIYNELGYVGLGLSAILAITAIYHASILITLRHPEAKLHFCLVLYCLLLNLGESTFLRSVAFMNIIFIASFIRTAAIVSQARDEKSKLLYNC